MVSGIQPCVADWKRGFRFDGDAGEYVCLFCGARHARDEVFPAGERFFNARAMAARHVVDAHGSPFEAMLARGKRATGLSDVQAGMMASFYRQQSDREIAARTGNSPSTIRYQRHALRERARQASVFLAMAELMEESLGRRGEEGMIEIHPGATMVDERYATTEEEAQAILRASFSSLEPLKLRALPPKEKKKLVVLRAIAGQFERGVRYGGRAVDEKLEAIHEDYATIRRYLIEYGFMDRTRDGKEYWRI